MLATISIVTGICAGSLALIQAARQSSSQPEKARQLRLFSLVPFGMAAVMVWAFFT